MKILVTGSAGFIGYHLTKRLAKEGHHVVGLDNLNHYYDVRLKLDRLADLGIDTYEIAMGKRIMRSTSSSFQFIKMDLKDDGKLLRLFEEMNFDLVFNMAAQAGVRYSIEKPQTYVDSNLVGFANLLEACRHFPVQHLIYASSSSVYGANTTVPFQTTDNVDHPVSLYAATKKCNELMAHSYSHVFKIPTTGLRLFTVYGEWGRPDMAAMLFAKAIMNDQPIKVFNNGDMSRDFTYVGDIVEGLIKVMEQPPKTNNATPSVPYYIYNLGNSRPVNLMEYINTLEEVLGKKAEKIMYPLQKGEMKDTYADVSDLIEKFNYQPDTPLKKGLKAFANWYLNYYHKDTAANLALDTGSHKN
jgi:UDP-glucuronate 4-epimerase